MSAPAMAVRGPFAALAAALFVAAAGTIPIDCVEAAAGVGGSDAASPGPGAVATGGSSIKTALPPASAVFEAGIGGFPCVRVPSLLAVPNGPLLAFAECRSFTGDGCEPSEAAEMVSASASAQGADANGAEAIASSRKIDGSDGSSDRDRSGSRATRSAKARSAVGSSDLRDRVVCARASADGGVTWGPLQPNISRGWGMYPTAVYVAATSSVIVQFNAWPDNRSFYDPFPMQVVSTDHGATWGPPTPVLPHVPSVSLFLGSCRGAALASGPHAGRLLFVGYNHSLVGARDSLARVWGSDDNGASWSLAPEGVRYMGEPQISAVRGVDGGVVLYGRSNGQMGCKCQNAAASTTSGDTWSATVNKTDLPSPGCQGSVLMVGGGGGFYSGPGTARGRYNMTVFSTADGGARWSPALEVGGAEEAGMYSCLEDVSKLRAAAAGTGARRSGGGGRADLGLLWETSSHAASVLTAAAAPSASSASSDAAGALECVGPGCAIVFSRVSLPLP